MSDEIVPVRRVSVEIEDYHAEAGIPTLPNGQVTRRSETFHAVGDPATTGPIHDDPEPLLTRIGALTSLYERRGVPEIPEPGPTQPDPYVVKEVDGAWLVCGGNIPTSPADAAVDAVLVATCDTEVMADAVAQAMNAQHFADAIEKSIGLPPGLVLDDLIRKGRHEAWRNSLEG